MASKEPFDLRFLYTLGQGKFWHNFWMEGLVLLFVALSLLCFVLTLCLLFHLTGNLGVVGGVHPAKEVGLSLEQPSVVLVPESRLSACFVWKDVWSSKEKPGMVLESVAEICWRSWGDLWGGFCAEVLSRHSEWRCASTTGGAWAGRGPLGLLEMGCHWGLGHGKGSSVSEWTLTQVLLLSVREHVLNTEVHPREIIQLEPVLK